MTEYPGTPPGGSDDADHTAPITPQSSPTTPPPPPPPPAEPAAPQAGPVWNPSSAQWSPAPSTPPPPPPPAYGAAPAYGQAPGYGPYGAFQPPPPSHPRATTAMVLGIIGLGSLLICGLGLVVSPFAWAFGQSALREIRESQGRLGGESQARAGQIMGIIGTVLLVLAVVAITLLVIGIASADTSGSFDTSA